MAVVAAGVHAALVDTGEFLAGLLGDGQGVNIRAQQYAAARRAVLAIGVGCGAAKGRHQARLKGALVGDIHGVELVGDVGGRALFGEAQLRVLMEVPALLNDVGFKLGGDILDAAVTSSAARVSVAAIICCALVFVMIDLLLAGLIAKSYRHFPVCHLPLGLVKLPFGRLGFC